MDRNKLEKAGYRFLGQHKHAAIKICHWTKSSLRGKGACYKERFYSIKSHRCLQLAPAANYCNHRCSFCWRDIHFAGDKFIGYEDEADALIANAIMAQRELLCGFGSNTLVDKQRMDEAYEPNQCALSLTGEATLYPKLPDLIIKLHERGFTSFLVTNGTRPDVLRQLKPPPTQLYLSLSATDRKTYLKIARPKVDYWDQILESLSILREVNCRTVVRLTLIKGINLKDPEGYAKLIADGRPNFVELKSYMHIGPLNGNLRASNTLSMEETIEFAKEVADASGYFISDLHEPSKVVLLSSNDSVQAQKKSVKVMVSDIS